MIDKATSDVFNFLVQACAEAQIDIVETLKSLKEETKAKVVYIAGKVTDLPYKEVYLKFKARELELQDQGYVVINPCDHVKSDQDWVTAMKICIALLQFADHISLLPDWQDSKGARTEAELAEKLGITTLLQLEVDINEPSNG